MTRKSQNRGGLGDPQGSDWITTFLLPNLQSDAVEEVDRYRKAFEKEWGDTDLTRRYTSMLPHEQHNWLLNNSPKRYWDGLPKFYQAFIRGQMEIAAADGRLDNWPDPLVQLYMMRQMSIRGERSR